MSNQLATSKFNTYPKLDKQCLQPPPLGSEAHPFSSIITTIPLPFFFLPCPLFFSPWCSIFTQGLDLPCGWLANMLNSTVGTIYLRGLEAKAEWAPFPDTCLFVYSITLKQLISLPVWSSCTHTVPCCLEECEENVPSCLSLPPKQL